MAKKLIVYLVIIFFMISGTGFVLYKNNTLVARPSENINASIVFNNSLTADSIPASGANAVIPGGASGQVGAGFGQTLDMTLDINEINQGDFDLDIFSSDKFKNLQENTLIEKQPEVGKRDPFKPN